MFEITNLVCSYDRKNAVLNIPSLKLERGNLYFFIGASGIGKSTLLETLGMMNNAIMPNQGAISFTCDGNKIDLHQCWQWTDNEISSFRQKYFSFIFQNTNLMPSFTAGENMCYTLLLEGLTWAEASEKVKLLMPRLSLDIGLFDKNVQQLSGGQRQRLAFMRAFVSSFEVLFGDEPTGNLDPVSAAGLMEILRNYIKENNKTAIVVSHDITLATKYGDRIYYLRKSSDGNGGILDNLQYFENREDGWYHCDRRISKDIFLALYSYL